MARDSDEFFKKRPPLFWWLLANILAIAFAITAWIVCLNLFRDPTNPASYELMMKVGRIDPLESFAGKTVPPAQQVSSPQELEAQFKSFSASDLETLNRELRRSYLTNYKKPKFLTFVRAELRILEVRKLGDDDFLNSGVVVKGQALVRPDAVADPIPYPVFVEVLFPSEEASLENFQTGEILKLRMQKKQRDCAAILNVGTSDFEGRSVLFLTLVPLNAVKYKSENGTPFQIKPPAMANLKAPLPVLP